MRRPAPGASRWRRFAVAVFCFVLLPACRRAPAAPPAPDAWSPTRTDLLFVSNREGNGEIFLRHGHDGAIENLTRHPAGDNWPEWSPDAGAIAFQSNRAGNLDVYVMGEDGANPTQLTSDPEPDYLPAWSPDGRITFVSWRREPGDSARAPHVYTMNADGSDQRRLLPRSIGTSAPASWAPDGRRLAISRWIDSLETALFVVDLPGGVERRLTHEAGYFGAAAFSPDGEWIACYRDRDTTASLEIVRASDGVRRTVVAGGRNWYPRWSPDGRWLVYVRAMSADFSDLDLFAVPVAGGAPVRLADGPKRESEGRWRPRW